MASQVQVDDILAHETLILHSKSLAGRAQSLVAGGDLTAARKASSEAIDILSALANNSDDKSLLADVASMQMQRALIDKSDGKYVSALCAQENPDHDEGGEEDDGSHGVREGGRG